MKKVSVSRLRKLPLLLGTLLIVSVAAYGTRAYFSDSATQQGDIALTLGTVDIATNSTNQWEYKPVQDDNIDATYSKNEKIISQLDSKNKISNASLVKDVRPGDSFVKKYFIKNTGSLDVKVKLDTNTSTIKTTDTQSPIIVEIEAFADNTILNTKSEKEYTVKMTVNPSLNNTYNQGNENSFTKAEFDKLTLNYFKENLTFRAIQTNAKTSTPVE